MQVHQLLIVNVYQVMQELNVIFKKKIVEKMDVKIMGNVLLFHLMIQLIVIVQILGLMELIVKLKMVIISIQKKRKNFFFLKKNNKSRSKL